LLRHGAAVRQPAGFGSEWDTLYKQHINNRNYGMTHKKPAIIITVMTVMFVLVVVVVVMMMMMMMMMV